MTPKRFFFVMIGVFVLSIAGGGAMLYVANNVLKKRSSDVVAMRLESTVLEEQQTAFKTAKANVAKYNYLNAIIKSALPQDKDQARTVREIFLLAEQSGIKVKSIQFPSSSLGTVTSAAGASATAGGITQAKPVEGLKGVYSVEAVVVPYADNKQYKVSYNQLIDLLKKIESNRRAMQVANIQLTPLGQNPTDSISFTLTLNIFIKP